MVDYPILDEIANFILDNLEIFLLVITPLALVVTFIGKKIYERIHSVEEQTDKLLKDQKIDFHKRADEIEKRLNLFDEHFRRELDRTDKSVIKINDKHDELYKEFKNVQLDIVSELKVIRSLLGDKTILDNDTVFKKEAFEKEPVISDDRNGSMESTD